MRKITVSELRYRFPRVEAYLSGGEEIEVCRRRELIARLVPIHPKPMAYPDFATLSRRIFGKRKARKTGTDLAPEKGGQY